MRRIESPENAAAREFGTRLYDAVFAGDVGTQWMRSIDATEREQCGLRLRLRLSEAPQLADLPWEYLYSPATDDFVVLSSWTPVVRYISLERGAPPLTVTPPLKMLAMVSSPSDYPPLDVEAEWARLDEGLEDLVGRGVVQIERMERATLRELQRALVRDDFHLFHFIGHGGFDNSANDGVLLLETDEGRGREVSGHQLGTILDDARTIRVAVLNACEGARTSETDPFAGVAQSLVARGIPAVVAMQFEITDRAAIVFAHEFYTAIAGGLPVEGAVGEARRAIFGSKNDVEWGTAVLYMRAEDGRLFDLRQLSESTLEMERDTVLTEQTAPGEPVDETVESSGEAPGTEKETTTSAPEPETSRETATVDENAGAPTPKVAASDEAVTAETEVIAPEPAPGPEPEPGFFERYARALGAGVVAIFVIAMVVVLLRNGDGEGTTTTAGDEFQIVDSSEVTMVPTPGVTVDGFLGDWESLTVGYRLSHPVRDNLTEDRLGSDSVGTLVVAYDDAAMYVAVDVEDDIYAQANTGNQIWRGDALDINLYVGPGPVPGHPDADTFQLTMTPLAGSTGRPAAVLFVGDGKQFADNDTDIPVDVRGAVDTDGNWRLEARIPWSLFGLNGKPDELDAALFALFDNDGEAAAGKPLQAGILANLDGVFFQQPTTWGVLTWE